MVDSKALRLYNYVSRAWMRRKLLQYAEHLERTVYSDPKQGYMKYRAEHDEEDQPKGLVRVGIVNTKGELTWWRIGA